MADLVHCGGLPTHRNTWPEGESSHESVTQLNECIDWNCVPFTAVHGESSLNNGLTMIPRVLSHVKKSEGWQLRSISPLQGSIRNPGPFCISALPSLVQSFCPHDNKMTDGALAVIPLCGSEEGQTQAEMGSPPSPPPGSAPLRICPSSHT